MPIEYEPYKGRRSVVNLHVSAIGLHLKDHAGFVDASNASAALSALVREIEASEADIADLTKQVTEARAEVARLTSEWKAEVAEHVKTRTEVENATRELADARAEAARLRSYNEGLAKITADLERERDKALQTCLEQRHRAQEAEGSEMVAKMQLDEARAEIAEGCEAARAFGAEIVGDSFEPKWCVAAAVAADRNRPNEQQLDSRSALDELTAEAQKMGLYENGTSGQNGRK